MMRKLNVGVIGVGNMGRHHARIYKESEGVKLLAVVDTVEMRGQDVAERYGAKFYRDYREMLEKEEIEAVSIAVPTSLHYEVAIDCLKRGKHTFIEKPIALSLKEAEGIIKEAKKRGVALLIGHIERYNPAVGKIKDMVEKGELGGIITILAVRVGVSPPRKREEDVIADLAIHDIDICNFLLGRYPTSVYTRAGNALHSKKIDSASILLDYDGIDATIKVNWVTPVKVRKLSVTGVDGYLELNYITQKIRFYETIYEKTFDSFGDFVIKFGEPNVRDIGVKFEEPLKLELEDFVRCIRDGVVPTISAQDAGKALKIALVAKESYEKGEPVEIEWS